MEDIEIKKVNFDDLNPEQQEQSKEQIKERVLINLLTNARNQINRAISKLKKFSIEDEFEEEFVVCAKCGNKQNTKWDTCKRCGAYSINKQGLHTPIDKL